MKTKTKTKTIDTQCGIYNTEYRLIKHKDGTISVKSPYIKWTNNTGRLAFKDVKITRFVDAAIACFNGDDSEMSISEIVFENETR